MSIFFSEELDKCKYIVINCNYVDRLYDIKEKLDDWLSEYDFELVYWHEESCDDLKRKIFVTPEYEKIYIKIFHGLKIISNNEINDSENFDHMNINLKGHIVLKRKTDDVYDGWRDLKTVISYFGDLNFCNGINFNDMRCPKIIKIDEFDEKIIFCTFNTESG